MRFWGEQGTFTFVVDGDQPVLQVGWVFVGVAIFFLEFLVVAVGERGVASDLAVDFDQPELGHLVRAFLLQFFEFLLLVDWDFAAARIEVAIAGIAINKILGIPIGTKFRMI